MPRCKSTSSPKELAKIFRCHFVSLSDDEFSGDLEICLKKHAEFLRELFDLDMYPCVEALQAAIKLIWREKAFTTCMTIAKTLKALISNIHYKRRRMSSGSRSSSELVNFVRLADLEDSEPKLPLASSGSKTSQTSQSSTFVGPAPSIASLYGFAKTNMDETMLSQITVSSDGDSSAPIMDSNVTKTSDAYYFDHLACCLVKKLSNGETVMSSMQPGKDGFAEAVFPNGQVMKTEIVNLELFSSPMKKPATCLKRPASILSEEEEDLVHEEEESEAEEANAHEKVAPKLEKATRAQRAHKNFEFSNGAEMKLGQFTGQSYITVKHPGSLKYTLLVACSEKQAARNGMFHQNAMKKLWDDLQDQAILPEKAHCKKLLLKILGAKE